MYLTTWLLLGGIGMFILVAIAAAWYLFNRSWGQFPTQAPLPNQTAWTSQPATPPDDADVWGSDSDQTAWTSQAATPPNEASIWASDAPPNSASEGSTPTVEIGRVRIEHPLVRKAAERALGSHSRAAQYIAREGNELYFVFDSIPDAAERQSAYELMRRVQSGEEVDLRAVIRLMQLFSR
jgi:hypothetical protein